MNLNQIGQCPLPLVDQKHCVTLAHGEGGRLSRDLLERNIIPWLEKYSVGQKADYRVDASILASEGKRIAFSTDSYVVSPLFFPGGDIGKLAICGTCNDLSMVGAEPKWLSVSLILEEGFPLQTLDEIVSSLAKTASDAGIKIATGDTKVVPKGCADGIYINTSGIGIVEYDARGGGEGLRPGDKILVSGPIAQHGLSILSSREDFGIVGEIRSDCGLLWPAVRALLDRGIAVRAMRDATRGGVAAVLQEWALDCNQTMVIDQTRIPLTSEARGLVELLGLDPLFIANEGTMLLALQDQDAQAALEILRSIPISRGAVLLGEVRRREVASVAIERSLGRLVPLDEISHSLLPRIC